MKKYPRISKVKSRRPQGMCAVCLKMLDIDSKLPDVLVTIEFNHMRGDDEVYKVHSSCVPFKSNNPEFLKALGVE